MGNRPAFCRRNHGHPILISRFQSMPVTLQASLMMLLALFLFTTMGICIRLSSAFVPVIEVVFFRNFLAVLILSLIHI